MVILTTLGNLVGQVVLWTPPVSDNDTAIGGETDSGEEKPEISVNISTAVTPDADGKVPTGGVNIAGDTASVVVPEGVQMEEGATELALSVESISEPNEDVPVAEGETANSIDVHIDGVAKDNSVPMLITIKELFSKGLNTTSVKMYHVENGAPVEMALVSEPANHNEFSYDPATGDVVMCVASFSEYVTVENNYNFWEGKIDYSWYNTTDTEFTISSADQLAGLGVIVDGGYTTPDGTTVTVEADTFEGKTIKLGADIDLYGTDADGNVLSFNPIGFKYPGAKDDAGNDISKIFQGTFDGQNHTIKNLYQNGWAMGLSYSNAGGGLFAGVKNATIKNLTMKGADIVMEAVPMGTVAAYAYGECTFDNIRIADSTLQNYNWDIAAIVGGVNGKHTFSNIYIENSVTLSSLWGSFGGGIGGVIGSVYGGNNGYNEITMQNVDVACVLDVYNDVTSAYQWYAYRFCGMLIGNTNEPGADGKNAYTAQASFLNCVKDENGNDTVRVYYGDWVNYHYCKFTNQDVAWQNNYPWVRVEAGLSNPGYSNARYGHPIVDGVAVTDANHTHKEGDDCNLLIEFNQLYGGDQGVYGQPEHEGVTVQNYYYTITYIDNDQTSHIEEVKTSGDYDPMLYNPSEEMGKTLLYWENAYSQEISSIPAGNMNNYVLYPKWEGEYVVRFLKADETVVGWGKFQTGVAHTITAPEVPSIGDGYTGYWGTVVNGSVVKWEDWSTTDVNNDVLFYAYYESNIILLTPIFDENGIQVAYAIDGPTNTENQDIAIPETVNGYPVTNISDGAFSDFSNVRDIDIPNTMEYIGEDAFADKETNFIGQYHYETVQIFFDGTKEEWDNLIANSHTNWDQYLGITSVVICKRENPAGYYKLEGNYSSILSGKKKENDEWVWVEGEYERTSNNETTAN